MRSKVSRKSGRRRSVRPLRRTRPGRKVKSATRRRPLQRGSGIFDSIFSSKWLNWLDKKKDPEEDKKEISDLANQNETSSDKLDAELAAIKKQLEMQDNKTPLMTSDVPVIGQVGKGRRRSSRRGLSNRSKSSRHRRRT